MNGDMYDLIYEYIRVKNIEFTLIWMPSHLKTNTKKVRPEYVTDNDIEGNEEADRLADVAAAKFQIEDRFAIPYLEKSSLH